MSHQASLNWIIQLCWAPRKSPINKVDESSVTEYNRYNQYPRNPHWLDFTAPQCPAVDVSPGRAVDCNVAPKSTAKDPYSKTY